LSEYETGKEYYIRTIQGKIMRGILERTETINGKLWFYIGKEFIPISDISGIEKIEEIEPEPVNYAPKPKRDSGKEYCPICGKPLPERSFFSETGRVGKCCSRKCWKKLVMEEYVEKGKWINDYTMNQFSIEEQKEIRRIYKEIGSKR